MDGRILGLMLICHFVGDYYMQTGNIAKYKTTSFYYTGLHSLLYALPFIVAWGVCRFQSGAGLSILIMVVSHAGIDAGKCYLAKKREGRTSDSLLDHTKWVYVIDQMLHVSIIYSSVRYIPQGISGEELYGLGHMGTGTVLVLLYVLVLYQPFHISYELLRTGNPRIYDTFDPAGIPRKLKSVVVGVALWTVVWLLRSL